jgi:3-oxoacyl-[acyl-carrier protein] reductase
MKKKVAFITGASEGIGKAIALDFAKKGFSIYLLSRSKKKLKNLKNIIINSYFNNRVDIICHDMEKKISDNIYKYCKNKLGIPNILINNSGGPEPGNFLSINQRMWERTIYRNLISNLNLSTIFSKHMIKNKWGRIITISSTIAKEPSSEMVQSATVRAAALAFNKSISFDLAKFNITVNSILLGGIETNRLKALISTNAKKKNISETEYKKIILKNIPIARFGKPEEVAALVSFLISDDANYLNGQSLIIDGGMSKII